MMVDTRWLWFGVFVAFVAGLVGFLLRLMGPGPRLTAAEREAQHQEALRRYAWGRHLPGVAAFWVAIQGLSGQGSAAPASPSLEASDPNDGEAD